MKFDESGGGNKATQDGGTKFGSILALEASEVQGMAG